MGFFLKRYIAALRTHKQWAWLALLAPLLYLAYAALGDVRYSVSQDFSAYSPDIALAASNNPIATIKLGKATADPDLLFLDALALGQLQKRLGLVDKYGGLADDKALRSVVRSVLSLSPTGDSGLRLVYTGADAKLGKTLVAFYTERLMKRIAEGSARTRSSDAQTAPAFQPAGKAVAVGERSLWRAERLRPAVVALLLGVLGVLGLIAVVELSDPSFKSERQIARYLGIPVLGGLPDAAPLLRTLPQ